MTKSKKIINLLLWISILGVSCKKKLNSDFDPIIGKWKWVKSVHGWQDFSGLSHSETVATFTTSSDTYFIEFLRKGKIITYKNSKVEDKFRVKDYQSTYISYENVWGYDITLQHKELIQVTYYVSKDTLIINDFFPKSKADYGIQDIPYSYIENCFVRE